ncbi:MAG: hypothetical protein JWL70_2719, partial [Acidimicrobiia bacterium]|nr:hypothetical protein [Acidimicrobiia bacterium]
MDDHCDECGFDARSMSIEEVAAALRQLPPEISATVAAASDEHLRTRPAPASWSAIEYLGHLRDLMAYHRWLIEQALSQDRPVMPPADPDAAVADSGYQDAQRDEILSQFARRVERLATLLDTLSPSALVRPLVLDRPIDVQLVA